jgi:hypothetical protein
MTGLVQRKGVSDENKLQNLHKRTYPIAVPRKGARRNMDVALARLLGGKRSAFVAAPTARTGLPVRPAKKRQMSKDARLVEKPAPRVKSMLTKRLRR